VIVKKLILLFSIILNCQLLKSQSWCPQGAVWYFNHWDIWSGSGYLKWTYIGTSAVIDGKTCNQFTIEKYAQVGNVSVYGYFTYFNNNVVYNVPTVGSIKDTLFDFNAKPGDKWRMAPTNRANCAASKVIVLDTGTAVIQGQKLRWLKVNYLSNKTNIVDFIYERFGALYAYPYNWFNVCPAGSDGEFGGSLRCYSDHQISNFVNDHSQACNYYFSPNIVGITKNLESENVVAIFPNPFSDFLTINFQNASAIENYEIKLLDFLGRASTPLSATTKTGKEIDLSSLPKGIYFLQIWHKEKLIGTEKLIKQ